jgi:peroxiredoxin
LPSTPSSTSASGDDSTRRPSRAALALVVLVSVAIPAGALALILAHSHHSSGSSSASNGGTPTTDSPPVDTSKARVGTPAPDFTLRTTAGKPVTLSDLRGHPVVIAFFASWCQPCEQELPVLEHFQREDSGRLQVIGVNFQDLPGDTTAFVRRLGITFPALLEDPSGPIAQRYGVLEIPQTIFVDKRGVVLGRVYGQTSKHDLQPAIDDLLNGVAIRPV